MKINLPEIKKMLSVLFALAVLLVASCSKSDDVTIPSVSGDEDDDQTTATIDSSYRYQLPVIVHVFYKDRSDTNQYVAYRRISQIIENVNELWQGRFAIDGLTSGRDMGVRFFLATVDPDGRRMSTPGVEYIRYDGDYPIDAQEFMRSKANVNYLWEPNEYINIMMFEFKQSGSGSITLGLTSLPYSISGSNPLEGLTEVSRSRYSKSNLSFCYSSCINSRYQSAANESNRYTYYKNVTSQYMTAFDINNTIAHELGHYLGLHHTFTELMTDSGSEPADSCGDTDYCADTPSYNIFEYRQYLAGRQALMQSPTMRDLAVRYPCDGRGTYIADNFMDYWCDYYTTFTRNQWQRVRHVLSYSPLIPGPKLGAASANTRASAGVLLPQSRIVECRAGASLAGRRIYVRCRRPRQ